MINLTKIARTALLLTGIPQLVEATSQLRQVSESCQQIIENFNAEFQAMPRSKSCAYSKVPEGRTFCGYFKRCCISHCRSCKQYENKYL